MGVGQTSRRHLGPLPHGRGSVALALCLWLACSGQKLPFPDLPSMRMESFLQATREQIEAAYTEAKAHPRDAAANGKLGMVLDAYEQYELAEPCYQRARFLDPSAFHWAYYLGQVQAATGKHQLAAETLRQAVRLKPDYLPARLKLAESLYSAGDHRETKKIYEAVIKEDPSLPAAYYGLARVKEAGGDLTAAIEHYRKACDLFPEYAAAHYALALVYRRSGDAAAAQEQLARYQKNQMTQPPLADPVRDEVKQLNNTAQQHLSRGVRLEAAGEMEQAVAEHERAIEINPQLAQAHTNLITLYGKLRRPEKAEAHYRASVAINPNAADTHYNFGVLLYEQGKYREAGEAFRKALEINPYYPEAHNNLAFVLERQGRAEEALAHYRAAVENKPNYRLAHFHLGRVLLSRGKNAGAIEHFLQTLTPEDESTPGFMYGLAAAYARSGDRSKALYYAKEARRRAEARGQQQLVESIDRDMRTIEGGK